MDRIVPGRVGRVMVAALGCVALLGCGGGPAAPGTKGPDGSTGTDGGNPPGSKRVFFTATVYSGNLGGSAGADAICTAASDAVGLGGRWTAWISTSTSDALSRIQDVGPWYLLDGSMAFTNKANFRTMPLVPIAIDEHGAALAGGRPVWTGTLAGAIHSDSDCEGFSTTNSSAMGTWGNAANVSAWTANNTDQSCASTGSLYCIEQ